MAKFKITDNKSGKTLVISGDNPPSEQEAEQLFEQSGIRNDEQPKDNKLINSLGEISKFLMPNVVKTAQEGLQKIGAGNLTPSKPSFQSIGASLAGGGAPIGESLLGTPEQKSQQAGNREAYAVIEGTRGIAGGVQGGVTAIKNAIKAKSISPSRIATSIRESTINSSKADILPDDIKSAFIKAGENATGGIRNQAMEYAASDAERLAKNPITTTKQLVEEISKQWGASRSSKGTLLTKAQAQYADDARNELMKVLQAKDPIVYEQTRKIGRLIKNQETFGKLLKILIPPTIVGGALKSLN